MGYEFSLGLTSDFGIHVQKPRTSVSKGTIGAHSATPFDIDVINREVRSRASRWLDKLSSQLLSEFF